ncbi:MAG: hypothetical protein JOZ25_10390 [Actinobacteria bacterium]|nr:hypothetical protein [Actinomycetota bacterium]
MRNRELHDALREFALEAAAQLTTDVDAGAEVAYDVVEEPGTGSVLYRYQPLTREFIDGRWDVLRTAPSCKRAAEALGSGAELYLRVRGEPAAGDAEPALRAMLDRLYEDATDFHFPEERFARVYGEVERTLYEDSVRTAVVAAVAGLQLESDRVDLGAGLVLVSGERIDAPSQAVWPSAPEERERAEGPNVLVALERDEEAGTPLPASEARIRFRRLITALRLFKRGRVALGGIGWGRADGGVWQQVPIASSGPGRGEPWVLAAREEPELREVCELVSSAPNLGRVRWALARFEMGCERSSDVEALSDYLLALESLLDVTDETGRASMGLRLAALCAEEGERKAVRRRLEAAFALERAFMSGAVVDPELDGADDDIPPAHVLVAELEQHARALLRDVVCGYLSPDLCSVADDVLLASSEPIEIHAAAIKLDEEEHEHRPSENVDHPASDEADHPVSEDADHPASMNPRLPEGPGTAADPRSAAWAVATAPGPRTRREQPPRHELEPERDPAGEPTLHGNAADQLADPEAALGAGVTPSADWELDDDPASYSAPI